MMDPVFQRAVPSVQFRNAIADIVLSVASEAGITVADLLGRSHRREFAQPRQFAMWRARQETKASLPQIGRFFNRDHTTVINAIRRVEARIHHTEEN